VLAAAVLSTLACRTQPAVEAVATVNGHPILASALARALPSKIDSTVGEEKTKRRFLDELIDRELFVQEAERLGLESEIATQFELEKKAIVTQGLFEEIAGGDSVTITELELQAAYRLLQFEDRIGVIDVPAESLAQRLAAELERGAPFETLAVRHSVGPEAANGGDQGYLPEFAIQEPLRSPVLALQPGGHTGVIPFRGRFLIIRLLDRKPAERQPPPIGEMRQELEWRCRQQRRREVVQQYIDDLRARLEYNPEGMRILTTPVDSITVGQQDTWVAIRDKKQYVKVGRLLHVARRFPASLDTTMRTYAIRRAIEEDLLYEDGLARGIDRRPAVREQLDEKRAQLLHDAFFRRQISERAQVSEDEIRGYYEAHQENFLGSGLDEVSVTIRHRLQTQRSDSLASEFRRELRSRAKIVIDDAALARVKKEPEAPPK